MSSIFKNSVFKNTIIKDFSPFDISDMALMLDGLNNKAFIFGDGNKVQQHGDDSGNGNDAINIASTHQPTYANNRITFDGNDYLTCIDNATLRMGAGEFTHIVVGKIVQSGQQQRFIMKGRAGAPPDKRYFLEVGADDKPKFSIDDATVAKSIVCSSTALNEDFIMTGVRNNTDQQLELYKNGVQCATPVNIGAYGSLDETNPTSLYIGAETNGTDYLVNGSYQLILMYKKRLKQWEFDNLHDWIKANYTIG